VNRPAPFRTRLLAVAFTLPMAAAVSSEQAATPPSAASAPSAAMAPAGPRNKLARADAEFMQKAAEVGHTEVAAGKVAVAKAVNTQVRGFAQQMIDDHGRSNAELSALAASKGLDLSGDPSITQSAKIDLLSSRDGAGFDRSYAQTFGVRAHRAALDLFQKAADRSADPEVKAFAAKVLPTLEHHLEMAKEMQALVDKEGNAKAIGNRKQ
jgi:putative membrane protein